MNINPFFSANLIVTNAAGEYYGIRSFMHVIACEEFLRVGNVTLTYDRLIFAKAVENRLFLQFFDPHGKSVEVHLKYNTFLPSTAPKKLRALVRKIAALMPKRKPARTNEHRAALAAADRPGAAANTVTVFSSRVSFPPFCPECGEPAATVAKLGVGALVPASDFLKTGYWLVPVCAAHRRTTPAIRVKNWSPDAREIGFELTNPDYARAFLEINNAPLDRRRPDGALLDAIVAGIREFRYVIYEYYVSAVFFSFLQLSDVHELRRDRNRFVHGLKYNAVTAVAGWWSFPTGPLVTVVTLLKNLAGGTDVTPRAVEVLKGKPFPAIEEE
ncbi:MAG: hypothetical protein JSS81_26435 [Acidobacteria bacterium]|nr:hypothetical protein [Acidobacteriota bacterium]